MRAWLLILAGLTVWAGHFFVLYGIGSALPGRPQLAIWWVAAVTAAAVVGEVAILRSALMRLTCADAVDQWIGRVAAGGAAVGLLAVVWQAAPALFV